jgi:Fe-Mn family superoxide dismutase
MSYSFLKTLIENTEPTTLERVKLADELTAFGPSVGEGTMNYHYGQLYKAYCDRFNKKEGDVEFNQAGAFLHSKYFSQFKTPVAVNKPTGASLEFINQHFDNFKKFKEDFKQAAMAIQGSGWAYLARDGKIKTIKNHQIKNDIVLIIDWWEHAWALDYQSDKEAYLLNQWKIIDWNIINQRI